MGGLTMLAPERRLFIRTQPSGGRARSLRQYAAVPGGTVFGPVASHDPHVLEHTNGTLERQVTLVRLTVGDAVVDDER